VSDSPSVAELLERLAERDAVIEALRGQLAVAQAEIAELKRRLGQPPLTTFVVPKFELGRTAAYAMHALIRNPSTASSRTVLHGRIAHRASTGQPARPRPEGRTGRAETGRTGHTT
jgi:DNA-binding LacI/PurR family transcriptional regulator